MNKLFVKRPWSKESEMVFRQLGQNGRAYIKNNPQLPREFGMKCKELIQNDLLYIATTRNRKEKRTWFITPPDIMVVPKYHERGLSFHFKRFKIL
jgi:hypothetical protein